MAVAKLAPNRHPNIISIVNLFKNTSPGDIKTKADINTVTRSTPDLWKDHMAGAKNVLRRDFGIVVEWDRKVKAYRHIKADEKSGVAERRVASARKKIRRGVEIMDTVTQDEFEALAPSEQTVFVQTRARLNLFNEMMSPKRKKQLDKAVVNNGKTLPEKIRM